MLSLLLRVIHKLSILPDCAFLGSAYFILAQGIANIFESISTVTTDLFPFFYFHSLHNLMNSAFDCQTHTNVSFKFQELF